MIDLVCFDMAGTTMSDQGLVLEAFERTLRGAGLAPAAEGAARAYVIETMGQSKIDVFRHLVGERAEEFNQEFERNFRSAAADLGVREIEGVRGVVGELRGRGVRVALTTGFSPETREHLIALLDWSQLFPVRVSPREAGRGRPAPDMLWWSMRHCEATSVHSVVVVGDTASDMEAGVRAGVAHRVGVLTGTDAAERLRDAGATRVVESVTELIGADLDWSPSR